MPRRPDAIRLTGFGGLKRASGQKSVPITDAQTALNVVTHHGAIEARPGYQPYSLIVMRGGFRPTLLYDAKMDDDGPGYLFVYGIDPTLREDDWRFFPPLGQGSNLLLSGSAPPRSVRLRNPGTATYNGILYVAAGGTNVLPYGFKIYNDGTQFVSARLGIEAPPHPGQIPSGPGSLSGTFSYRITFYNSKTDTESGPSLLNPAATTNVTNQTMEISGAWPNDPQVDTVRIYRRQTRAADFLTPVDSAWYRAPEWDVDRAGANAGDPWNQFDNGESVLDTDPAAGKIFLFELRLIDGTPPSGRAVTLHRRRMWWGVSGGALRYSEIDRPEQVDPRNEFSFGDPSDPLEGVMSAFGQLVVFKRHSVWSVSGSTPSSFVVNLMTDEAGCSAQHTVVRIGGALYFCDKMGAYRIGPSGLNRLSADVLLDWRTLWSEGDFDRMTAAHYPDMALYVVSGLDNTGQPQQLAYDYRNGNWFRWTLPSLPVAHHVSHRSHQLLWATPAVEAHTYNVSLGSANVTTDNGAAIPWSWQTPMSEFNSQRAKKFYHIGLSWETESSETALDTVDVAAKFDDGDEVVLGSANPGTRPLGSMFRIGTVARQGQFRLSGESRGRTRIHSAEVAVELVNWRPEMQERPVAGVLAVSDDVVFTIREADDFTNIQRTFTITNAGEAQITVDVTPLVWGWGLLGPAQTVLEPGQTADVTVFLSQDAFDESQYPFGTYVEPVLFSYGGGTVARTATLNVLDSTGVIEVTPLGGFACVGIKDDPPSFAPLTMDYLITNTGDYVADWMASFPSAATVPCLSANQNSGYLLPGASTTLTLSFNAECAAGQAVGTYSGLVTFSTITGVLGPDSSERPVSLTVLPTDGGKDPINPIGRFEQKGFVPGE